MLKNIHHIAIICSDYQVSKRFYTEILGLEIIQEIYREERQSYKLDLMLAGVYVIELFSFPNPPKRLTQPEATGLRHLAFGVASVDNYRKYLLDQGVKCEAIRLDKFTGKYFFFAEDPDHLPLEFYALT